MRSQTALAPRLVVGILPADADRLARECRPGDWSFVYSRTGELELAPSSTAAALVDAVRAVDGWGIVFDPAGVDPGHSRRRCAVPSHAEPEWELLLARLWREAAREDALSRQAAAYALGLLLVDARRLFAETAPAAPEAAAVLAAAGRVIEARFRESLSLADVAAATSLSPSQLARIVRRASGRSIGEWIRDRRMREARKLLSDSDMPVDAVAASIGYRDTSHFRRHFQRTHGTTPGRWRESARPHLGGRIRASGSQTFASSLRDGPS